MASGSGTQARGRPRRERQSTRRERRELQRSARKAARAERRPRRRPRQWLSDNLGRGGQAWLLLRCTHPLQAVVLAAAVGALAAASDRGLKQSLVAAAAVLLVQAACGLINDVCDAALDHRAKVPNKPVASGALPAGNASYLATVLILVAIPVSVQSGTEAGIALLATVPIAFVHNRILHRTPASFVGWMLTFALYPVFLAYGGWGGGRHGDDPTWQFILVSAFVGLCVHFATTLPDLVADNAAGVRSLPLVIALKTGAPRLLLATIVVSIGVAVAFVLVGLDPGLRQW